MKQRRPQKTLAFISVIVSCVLVFSPLAARTADAPKLANYYLHWNLTEAQAQSLARWDLVILDAENQFSNPQRIKRMRQLNPNIVILAYITPQEIKQDASTVSSKLRKELHSKIADQWYLKSSKGSRLSWWPGTYLLNVTNQAPKVNGKRFNEFFVSYTVNTILGSGLWDGVFYDNAWDSITYFAGSDVDADVNGARDSKPDTAWQEGMRYIYNETKKQAPGKIIIGNGTTRAYKNELNGSMIENFVAPTWGPTMETYKFNDTTGRTNIINSNAGNTNSGQTNYKNMRFGLGSTLLGDGYYAYDKGDQDHGQTWWYDEYDVELGDPLGKAISEKKLNTYQADIWRRDFEHGITILNSTDKPKTVVLNGEYEKIHGIQDPKVNNGMIVNEVTVDTNDSIILMKTFAKIDDVLFPNGGFARFFDVKGNRVRNGFFTFEEKYKGGDQVAHIDVDGNGKRDLVVARGAKLSAWQDDGQPLMTVYPFTANYKGEMRIAIGDINGDKKMELLVAPSDGYPAPIKVYTLYGAAYRADWYPYGTQYKGGFHIAVADVGNDLGNNIILGAGVGREPIVDMFDYAFNRVTGWRAFEATFKGGIDVASGDLDGDGIDEIIVGAGPGKEPVIKVYSKDGKQLAEFKGYTSILKQGIDVETADVDFDGKKEIVGFSEGPGL